MLTLRYVYLLALIVWLGGMVVLGALVAPTTFAVLQASDPVGGRRLAGDVFGAVIARFHYVAYAAGTILLVTLGAMRLLGPKPAGGAVRAALVAGMLGVALYSGLVVGPALDALLQNAASRVRFDELHQLSTRLMLLNLAGALVLLYWEAREK